MFTIAPRVPSTSTGSVLAMAAAASRRQLNVPIRLTRMIFSKDSSGSGLPSRSTVRPGAPMPAALTAARSGAISMAASTATCTCSGFATSAFTYRPPSSEATASPSSSLRSISMQRAPRLASARAEAAPMPEAPPVMMADVPASSIQVLSFGGSR